MALYIRARRVNAPSYVGNFPADEGFILDEALPTTVEEGRASFAKYLESARLFIPNGKPIAPGDRFVNKDYAETLRTIAKEGGQSFYRGSIAQKIVRRVRQSLRCSRSQVSPAVRIGATSREMARSASVQPGTRLSPMRM